MGLFAKKHTAQSQLSEAELAAQTTLDDQFREELRELSRAQMKELIDQNAGVLRDDIASAVKQVAVDIKQHMAAQLDGVVAGVNEEITKQLQERIGEYNRLASEAQNEASASLTRDSQAVYEKYQQFSAELQQTVSQHEVVVAKTLEEGRNRIAAVEQEQRTVLAEIHEVAEASRKETAQLQHTVTTTVQEQLQRFETLYQESLARVTSASEAHEALMQALQESSRALQQRQQQLNTLLDNSVAEHKAVLIEAVHEHLARIIEHYLLNALGESSSVAAQLPDILKKLEENKQAMTDDMAL